MQKRCNGDLYVYLFFFLETNVKIYWLFKQALKFTTRAAFSFPQLSSVEIMFA